MQKKLKGKFNPESISLLNLSFICAHRDKGKTAQFCITALEERDDTDDAAYWLKYPNVLPMKTERLWDALVDGLEKYRSVPTFA